MANTTALPTNTKVFASGTSGFTMLPITAIAMQILDTSQQSLMSDVRWRLFTVFLLNPWMINANLSVPYSVVGMGKKIFPQCC